MSHKMFKRNMPEYLMNDWCIKTHDYPSNAKYPDYCKYIFLYGDPVDIVKASYVKIKTRVEGEAHFKNFHVPSNFEYQDRILEEDVLNLEKLFDAWNQRQNNHLLFLHYENIWNRTVKINNFTNNVMLQLPPQRPRKDYSKDVSLAQEEKIKQTYSSLIDKVNSVKGVIEYR